MITPLSRLSWTCLSRRCTIPSRYATIVFAERYARIQSFHSQQQQQQQERRASDSAAKTLLTSAALISGLIYVLYNWKDGIRERIAGLRNLGICPVLHAVSLLPPSNGPNRNRYNFIADVVEVTAPSVVCIEIIDNRR